MVKGGTIQISSYIYWSTFIKAYNSNVLASDRVFGIDFIQMHGTTAGRFTCGFIMCVRHRPDVVIAFPNAGPLTAVDASLLYFSIAGRPLEM